jgi:hypothetical protein
MLNEKLLLELRNYVERHSIRHDVAFLESPIIGRAICDQAKNNELEDFIKNTRKPTFNQVLFRFIDQKGVSDSEIYKKAGIDRRHFSKIRSNPEYRPGKYSAIALTMALELNKKEADKLLSAAGYSLSESDTFDLVIQFCLEKQIYDIQSVNEALDYFSLKPLAATLD